MPTELNRILASALPADETLLGSFEVRRAMASNREDDADAPPERQPKVLAGCRRPGDRRRGLLSFLFESATLTDPKPGPVRATNDPADRAKRQKRNGRFFGTWDSLAGLWLAAGQPQAETGVITYVALSATHLRFVYVQNVRRSQEIPAVEPGACFRRADLLWTRRRESSGKEFQFGFMDNSWGTFVVPSDKEFLALFPGTLTHKDLIP
ncbi:hypothetical protein [Streptomyces sp. NPDC020742]|uniref:hypothetical protein n=1 Tax=Streptomyces sp. NPDC020742 TaxID=3154897 RepID=UPI0033F0D5E0